MRKRIFAKSFATAFLAASLAASGFGGAAPALASEPVKEVTLRVANWEEYIDEGGWDEDETIALESGDIIGVNNMIQDFEEWYLETYGVKVNVEYSTFGTPEDLYNMLTLGDEYDVICPSEYLFMKLMAEDALVPLSESFFDTTNENNYYTNGVSPFIRDIFDSHTINGESWSKYAAGYMWGITGVVYNPEYVTKEDASTWNILLNDKYRRQLTLKDSVRECYFAAVGALKADLLTSEDFINDPDYAANLEKEMNDTSPETIQKVEEILQAAKDNVYAFETDSGKADMVTGKVVANYQWSGDGVYTLDQADEDGLELSFAVPVESTNIYFDGWVMLKSGVGKDSAKQQAAEAWINYLSRPDNVIRNMYYIGYTSCISGGEDRRIFEYAEWCYGADEDEENTEMYSLDYFFGGGETEGEYEIEAPADQIERQLSAQYPSKKTMERSSIMTYFDQETSEDVNSMWVHVRCFNITSIPVWVWILLIAAIIFFTCAVRYKKKQKLKWMRG